MKVIVSTALEDKYVNFVVVKDFNRVKELNGVDTLIIHRYDDTDFNAGVHITDLYNKGSGIKTFIYINESPSTTMKMTIRGVKGFCFEDEFYFEDEDELVALIEELDSEEGQEFAAAAPALDVLDDFVGAFAKGDDRVKTPLFLAKVTDSVKELSEITQQQQLQLDAMGTSALEVFYSASNLIRNMKSQNSIIESKLRELEAGLSNGGSSNRQQFQNSVQFFSQYTYRGSAKVLLIREYAPCRYLTSFVLGYLHHLHYELNRRPKAIFVIAKGQGTSLKYDEWPIITNENMTLGSLYSNEIVATSNPKREVMKDLLTTPNDVFIVVDRLYGSVDIVSGRHIKINAVGSRSDVARYKIKPDETIFPVTKQPVQLFDIPVIKSFPVEVEARYAAYAQIMGDRYKLLDLKLGLATT